MTRPSACSQFERWLDEGSPSEAAEPMRRHASTCARCAASLEAAAAIDAWLDAAATRDLLADGAAAWVAPASGAGSVPASLPRLAASPEFTDHLMSRIASLRPGSIAIAPDLDDAAGALPWWAEVMRQPVAALAWIAAALVAWRMNALLAFASSVAAAGVGAWDRGGRLFTAAAQTALAPGMRNADALVIAGVLLGLTPLAIVASLALGRWVARIAGR